jgi:hypothetical protein
MYYLQAPSYTYAHKLTKLRDSLENKSLATTTGYITTGYIRKSFTKNSAQYPFKRKLCSNLAGLSGS